MMGLMRCPESKGCAWFSLPDVTCQFVGRCQIFLADGLPQLDSQGVIQVGLAQPQKCQLVGDLHHRMPQIRKADVNRDLHERVFKNGDSDLFGLSR